MLTVRDTGGKWCSIIFNNEYTITVYLPAHFILIFFPAKQNLH
jgi:hypothetical protein